jgi:hypothetical protein
MRVPGRLLPDTPKSPSRIVRVFCRVPNPGALIRELDVLAAQTIANSIHTPNVKENKQNYRKGDHPNRMTTSLNPRLIVGSVWDAGLNMEGPMAQRGRWGVKREAHNLIVFYHFFFPKLEVTIKTFKVGEDDAAKEYARQCCEKKNIPDRTLQKG